MKKVCVVTGSRSEYGLLKPLLKEISLSKKLDLKLVVTGSHLSKKHGYTISEILADSNEVAFRVEILSNNDSAHAVNTALSKAIVGISNAYLKISPDIVLLLGDRYEILGAAIAAMTHNIPIAHIHGGELTEGVIDEAIRHSVSKMASIHFVATEEYKRRVIQLGEHPKNVFNVGGMSLDSINNIDYFELNEIEELFGCKFKKSNLIVTHHPLTLDLEEGKLEVKAMLEAIKSFPEINFFFTMPNADTGNDLIRKKITKFVNENKNTYLFESLGQRLFLSALRHVDGIIGNSSSGLLEAPAFHIGTVNIGDRQKGRVQAVSVVNAKPNKESIRKGIKKIVSPKFKDSIKNQVNPYGKAGASKKILTILKKYIYQGSSDQKLKKSFFDIKLSK